MIRKSLVFLALIIIWETAARWYDNPLMLPTFSATLVALYDGVTSGPLLGQIATTLKVLLVSYGWGILAALILTVCAQLFTVGGDFVSILTAMLSPIPSVAILPLALMWFGVSVQSIIFVVANAVLWPLTLNMTSGFRSVPLTWRMVGDNFSLSWLRQLTDIYIPGAFPQILAGLKISWAFAWRTLIAAELVFGVNSGEGGIGWFIFSAKNQLETASVFAGLLTVVIIGLATETLAFQFLERMTVKKWGMVR